MKKNVNLCIDVTTQLQHDALPVEGKAYRGTLVVKDEMAYDFVEKANPTAEKRNMRVFDGRYISLTLRPEDGQLRLNIKLIHLHPGFDLNGFAIGVMNEICQAMEGFVVK